VAIARNVRLTIWDSQRAGFTPFTAAHEATAALARLARVPELPELPELQSRLKPSLCSL